MGSGLAWLDYDGDGWWDLYAVQSGPFPPDGSVASRDRLFRNLGTGPDGLPRFEDVSDAPGSTNARVPGTVMGRGSWPPISTATATSTST